ncbi:MAG: GNAT family N-acetyltransferase, partial [Clostridium sp.]
GMVEKKVAYMEVLCVSAHFRGRGYGRKLFSYVSKLANEMGATRLDLMVWGFNKEALKFYEELGMKPQRYILECGLEMK